MRDGRFGFANRHTGHQLSNHISSWTPIGQVTESNADAMESSRCAMHAQPAAENNLFLLILTS